MFTEVTQCPISYATHSISYLDLGMMPLVNNLNDTRGESLSCVKFPLKVNYYPTSGLSMLSGVVDPNALFSNYVYKSGVSQPYVDHCKKMFDYISRFVTLKEYDPVVDIGGNDGTLLFTFWKTSNIPIWPINVDPSNLSQLSEMKNIETHREMWSLNTSVRLMKERKAKVITSTNVFQHTQPIRDFAQAVCNSLTEDGIWCLEFPYWKTNLETNQFDQIYHEHIYYYMVTPLKHLFNQVGLEIVDISEHAIHGGTMRVISRKKKFAISKRDNRVKQYLEDEKKFNEEYLVKWGQHIQSNIVGSKQYLYYLKHEGKKVAAFGAAAKGCIFLNAAGITHETIDYIVDDTDTKWGKFMPGTGLQIFPRTKLEQDPPDVVLILPHNFADYIVKSVRPIFKGKFVTMFPQITSYE